MTAIDGRPVSIDLFDRPDVLECYWNALVAGFSLDAGDERAEVDPELVTSLLEAIEAAPMEPTEAVGLGEELLFETDEVAGAALRWEGALVHLSAYALQ